MRSKAKLKRPLQRVAVHDDEFIVHNRVIVARIAKEGRWDSCIQLPAITPAAMPKSTVAVPRMRRTHEENEGDCEGYFWELYT